MSLVQFPADRRTADIRRCVKALQDLHGEEANRFWRAEMMRFACALREQGVEEAEVSHQAHLYLAAVQMELERAFAEERIDASRRRT
ncbi:hypothetical protein EPK99_15015 [Neorhizobium lilium]|uniref:Uncharacterized protein n=1 Tax=Neorhizobium lilium TaxID=2503024 RepID=A0A3S3RSK5_9HYPH|nr:DUF6074 family protein [Neorhizobium lilium]RWX76971.1 hypothetical protein EPK99_15015 [Neorhizobium lilium]